MFGLCNGDTDCVGVLQTLSADTVVWRREKYMFVERWWNDTDRGKPEYSETKPC